MGCNSSSTAVGPLNGVNEDAVSNAAESGPTPASSAASRATCVRCKAKEADDGDVNGEALPPPRASREVREVPDGEDEEAVDIDLEDPELEQAATRIQAAFRGHRARQQQEPSQEADAPAAPAAPAATMASDEPTKEQLEADFDPNDKGELTQPNTKIRLNRGARKPARPRVHFRSLSPPPL
ncbi:hypothetical protein ONE63_002919 [Megalurothrips usitatus]|uniref:Uncharacterized protein n=1 Tax=Megalurothrips usitatus TaxID=439358 RepID=A0AAV7XBQ5_9NEOP|nr:hypothetical protein ONE63_002919 [Megalurothrips usitatus]